MTIPQGYKQTEVGIIPEDWEVMQLSDIALIERGKFTARPRNDPKYYGGEIPFIQTGDVAHSDGNVTTFNQTLNQEGLKVSRLFPKGTLFFTIAANVGDVGIATFEAACPDSLVAITPKSENNSRWLLYELSSRQPEFEALASPGAQLNLNLEKLRPVQLPVPPPQEQQAISTVLTDIDQLLTELDHLITKKRRIKEAAMQELLTGQTRLPGFEGEWEERPVGSVARFQVGAPFSSAYFNKKETGMRLIRNRDLRGDGDITHYSGPYEDSYIVNTGDVLIGMDGDFEPAVWTSGPALLNQRVGRLVLKGKANLRFLYYQLVDLLAILETKISGTTVKHLSHGDVEALIVKLPPLPEQSAIAEVLSSMDDEITALEARRAKTETLKRGMMQELLTGRTRLAVD